MFSIAGALCLSLSPQCAIHSLLYGICPTQSGEHFLYGDNGKKPNESCPALSSPRLLLSINHLLYALIYPILPLVPFMSIALRAPFIILGSSPWNSSCTLAFLMQNSFLEFPKPQPSCCSSTPNTTLSL